MFLLVVLQLRCIIPDTSSGEFIYTTTHFKWNKISHFPAVDCKYFSVDIKSKQRALSEGNKNPAFGHHSETLQIWRQFCLRWVEIYNGSLNSNTYKILPFYCYSDGPYFGVLLPKPILIGQEKSMLCHQLILFQCPWDVGECTSNHTENKQRAKRMSLPDLGEKKDSKEASRKQNMAVETVINSTKR